MPSIREVATAAGVSPATVSRVMNDHKVDDAMRIKVLNTINELGYAPKSTKVATNLIALTVVSDLPTDMGEFDGALAAGGYVGAREFGFNLVLMDLSSYTRSDGTYTQFFTRMGIRGLLLRTMPGVAEVWEQLATEGFPHVMIADRCSFAGGCWIDTDSRQPSQEAIEHLIEMGHRRIAIGVDPAGAHDSKDRVEGYVAAHEAMDLPADAALTVRCPPTLEGGARAIDLLMSRHQPPTAAYMTHSLSALGALRRLHELGVSVPEEFSLVGFDDAQASQYAHPKLSVVRQNTHEMARQAAGWLSRVVQSSKKIKPIQETRGGWFELGGTTGIAPEQAVRVLPGGRRIPPSGA